MEDKLPTQQERDEAFMHGLAIFLRWHTPSVARTAVVLSLGTATAVIELSLADGLLNLIINIMFFLLMFAGIVESARLGLDFAERFGGWASTALIASVMLLNHFAYQLFQYLEWLPIHRTTTWAGNLLLGLLIGVLLCFAARPDYDE